VPEARETEPAARGIEHDRDVVLAASRLGEIDERSRGAVEIRAPHRRSDLAVRNVTGQTVGAEQEPVARAERFEEHVGLNPARIADESRDRALVLAGVIGRDEADVAVAKKIGAAVTEVSDHRRAAFDGRRHERRRRSGLSALAGGAEHRVVRAADRGRQGLGRGQRPCRRAEEALRERVDGGGARELAARLSADAVGYREERRLASLADEVAVFVVLPNAPDVGACRRLRSQP